jgi:diacylglycerol O-acyltransferase
MRDTIRCKEDGFVEAHLSPLDAAFLELEEADESAHMHIGWAMVFDPLPGGGVPTIEEVRAQTAARLDALPRFRRRLSSPRVGNLSLPTWVPDPDFDLEILMRRATLPAPGGEAELMDWLGDFFSHRLDRAHPLWETTLLDGLEGGRWALVTKAHHCLVDGISGVSVAATLLDAEPEPPPDAPTLAELAAPEEEGAENDRGTLGRVRGAIGGGVDAALHPRKVLSAISQSRSLVETLVRDEVIAAPHTSLNVPIGGGRRFAAVDVSLGRLKEIRGQLGGTVNDIVLAAVVGGLGRLFSHRDEAAAVDRIRAMVPVNLRQASEKMALGNRVSSLFVDLPVSEPDPLLRYRKVAAAVSDLKESGASGGTEAVIGLAGLTPPVIQSVIARLAFTPRLFNITITNVPGPPTTLYAFGAPMRRVVPLVPIFSGHAVGIAVVSYDGNLTFGINADSGTVRDIEVLRGGIEAALAELGELAQAAA